MAVHADISDLFFNTDHEQTEKPRGTSGAFAGYDMQKLSDQAQSFLGSLERLGVEVPEPGDLMDDFLARC